MPRLLIAWRYVYNHWLQPSLLAIASKNTISKSPISSFPTVKTKALSSSREKGFCFFNRGNSSWYMDIILFFICCCPILGIMVGDSTSSCHQTHTYRLTLQRAYHIPEYIQLFDFYIIKYNSKPKQTAKLLAGRHFSRIFSLNQLKFAQIGEKRRVGFWLFPKDRVEGLSNQPHLPTQERMIGHPDGFLAE